MNKTKKHIQSTDDIRFTFKWIAKKASFFYKTLAERNIQTQQDADEIENSVVYEAIDTDRELLQEWARRFFDVEVLNDAVKRTVNKSRFLKDNYKDVYKVGLAQTVILTVLYKKTAQKFLSERRAHEFSN